MRTFNLMPKLSFPIILFLGIIMVVKLPIFYLYPTLFLFLTIFFHFNRKDIKFLKKTFVKYWWTVVILENTIIYLFFLTANINYKFEVFGFSFLFLLFAISFINPNIKPKLSPKWNFIPNYLFEWKSFLRKNPIISIITFLLLLGSGYDKAMMIFFGILILDYYSTIFENNENKEMLEMYFKKYNFDFKIRKNLIFYNLLLLPTYLFFLVKNYEYTLYLLYYISFMNLYFLLILTRKYKIYNHKEKTNYYNMGVFIEYFFCSMTIIPAIFVLKENIKTARKNIKFYVGN